MRKILLTLACISGFAVIWNIDADCAQKKEAVHGAKVLKTQNLWPEGKMPDATDFQIAAYKQEVAKEGFNPDKHRMPYIEWLEKPEHPNGTCVILISGGGYNNLSDARHIKPWSDSLRKRGVQCVNLVYRTPRPTAVEYYRSAWEDGQRAVRMVRKQAAKWGIDPEKIGTEGMSAGSHLTLLLATNSETRAYERIDDIDDVPCHINFGIAHAPAYVTSDGIGTKASTQGYGPNVRMVDDFKFDSHTCPLCLCHGGIDYYTPNGSTLVYRQLRRMGIPAELHLYANKPHKMLGQERALEFLKQMGFLGTVEKEVPLMERFADDRGRASYEKENVWEGRTVPDMQDGQCDSYIEWHIPAHRTSDAIQIIYSGGGYKRNCTDDFEVAPVRRFLNEKGLTVVTLRYRSPRPAPQSGLAKYSCAWEDLQRAIKKVRSEAAGRGLNPDKIGIMGGSAGGHLTLLGVTSSKHQSYNPEDDIDKIKCNVQWGIAIYTAYALTDGIDRPNTSGGNEDSAILVPEFSFDLDSSPMLFIHGDSDPWAAMNSVKCWEKMRSIGVQCDLHTLATRKHCFQKTASPGTGSYTWLDRIWEFLQGKL